MPNLNIKKAVQQIRLDDSPDSPIFYLDLTDDSIAQMAPTLAGVFVVYSKLTAGIEPGKPMDEETAIGVASVYETIITTMLGEYAWTTIYQYLCDMTPDDLWHPEDVGKKAILPSHMTAIIAPIVNYLMGEYYDVITANRDDAVIKYLQGNEAPAL